MRALIAVAVLLALAGPAFATLGDNGMATYTGRKREPNTLVFGNEMVVNQGMAATLELTANLLKGTMKAVPNEPATEKKEVYVECLNSRAPPPLNWEMWCPGRDAKVVGWIDKSGAAHRQITLRPQAGMTSTMYQWFITSYVLGLMPPVVEFQGNHYWYYHLWHPLDHVESTWSLGPKVPILQKGLPMYVLIHERYRNPPNYPYNRHYETNGWFYVEDSLVNIAKNRYVITMPLMGLPTWTMILEFNDTPEGLVVDVEVVAGIPYKGYDERAPHDGYLMAAGLNEMFTAPLLAKQRGTPDWEESINAITRHVIEEFSNLQHFVPYLWEKHTLLGKAGINWVPTLGTWMQYNKVAVGDGASISVYHALAAMAAKQIDISNTTHGAAVDALYNASVAAFQHATDAITHLSVAKAQATYVPLSNTATSLAYEHNKANGAKPERDVTVQSLIRAITAGLHNGTNNTAPAGHHDGLVRGIHSMLNASATTINLSHGAGAGNGTGLMHNLGKGFGHLMGGANSTSGGDATAAVPAKGLSFSASMISSSDSGSATKGLGHNLGKGLGKMFNVSMSKGDDSRVRVIQGRH